MKARDSVVVQWCLNGRDHNVDDEEIRGRVDDLLRVQGPVDLSVVHGDGRIVNLFMSAERAFLLLMREAGDMGKVAVGRPGGRAEWRFRLANGQEDVYPDEMTIDREAAIGVLLAVLLGTDLPEGVTWRS